MKTITCNLPAEHDTIRLEIFSDLHIGSSKCDYQLINDRIKRVSEQDNTYAVCLGDFLNNSTTASVGDTYSEQMTPMQQMGRAIELFKPIKDKILLITSGNHERRSYRTDGIDLMGIIAEELGISDRYDYCACLLFIRFGDSGSRFSHKKLCYTLYASHGDGNGGGRLIGGKANGLQRRGQIIPQADIILTGHTHAPLSFRDCAYEINYGANSVILKEQLFVNASATLDYEEYAELYGMKPSSKISPVIVLDGKKKNMRVIL